jgi:hypothetical protein
MPPRMRDTCRALAITSAGALPAPHLRGVVMMSRCDVQVVVQGAIPGAQHAPMAKAVAIPMATAAPSGAPAYGQSAPVPVAAAVATPYNPAAGPAAGSRQDKGVNRPQSRQTSKLALPSAAASAHAEGGTSRGPVSLRAACRYRYGPRAGIATGRMPVPLRAACRYRHGPRAGTATGAIGLYERVMRAIGWGGSRPVARVGRPQQCRGGMALAARAHGSRPCWHGKANVGSGADGQTAAVANVGLGAGRREHRSSSSRHDSSRSKASGRRGWVGWMGRGVRRK